MHTPPSNLPSSVVSPSPLPPPHPLPAPATRHHRHSLFRLGSPKRLRVLEVVPRKIFRPTFSAFHRPGHDRRVGVSLVSETRGRRRGLSGRSRKGREERGLLHTLKRPSFSGRVHVVFKFCYPSPSPSARLTICYRAWIMTISASCRNSLMFAYSRSRAFHGQGYDKIPIIEIQKPWLCPNWPTA